MSARKRVLFVSEAITLAQIVRLATLAQGLDRARYEVHFASSAFPELVFAGLDFPRWPLWGLDARRALGRLDAGRRLYTSRVLARYIESDRAVLQQVRPELVVGDLRWSLAVSAPLCGVPYAALINAYWSPFAERDGFPVPDHPIVRLLGERWAARYFPEAVPRVFAHFVRPLNAQRRRFGLPEVGSLLEMLTFGDHVLYPDPPELIPVRALPAHHCFLGPVLWSAPGALPEGWGRDPARAPVYVTLGSSGDVKRVDALLQGLARLPVDVLLATAARARPRSLPDNVRVAEFVDGAQACRRARVVVHNGGSSTGYQALAAGRPVVGIPHNFDQYLAAERIDRRGAGLHLPARSLTADAAAQAVARVLEEPGFASAAQELALRFAKQNALESFAAFAARTLG
jgi:UDP:flavonoid glycosyltransferase YjiC (YdhE family)